MNDIAQLNSRQYPYWPANLKMDFGTGGTMQSDNITYMIGYRNESGEFRCEGEYSSREKAYSAWQSVVDPAYKQKRRELIECTRVFRALEEHIPCRPQTLNELLSECVLMEADSQATRTMEKAIAAITKLRGALEEIIETSGDKPYDPRIDITCRRIAKNALSSATN